MKDISMLQKGIGGRPREGCLGHRSGHRQQRAEGHYDNDGEDQDRTFLQSRSLYASQSLKKNVTSVVVLFTETVKVGQKVRVELCTKIRR